MAPYRIVYLLFDNDAKATAETSIQRSLSIMRSEATSEVQITSLFAIFLTIPQDWSVEPM